MSTSIPKTDLSADDLADDFHGQPTLSSERVFSGRVWDIVTEVVDLGEAGRHTRDSMRHPGAVSIVALNEAGEVLLQRQYRHPVRGWLWEVPAGLLDVQGETPLAAAQRELAEEADLEAEHWSVLVDYLNSPGGSDEAVRVFLARGLQDVPTPEGFERTGEEARMERAWVPLDKAVQAVLEGRIGNPSAVSGILAAEIFKDKEWVGLRDADSQWPQHKAFREH